MLVVGSLSLQVGGHTCFVGLYARNVCCKLLLFCFVLLYVRTLNHSLQNQLGEWWRGRYVCKLLCFGTHACEINYFIITHFIFRFSQVEKYIRKVEKAVMEYTDSCAPLDGLSLS